MPSFVQPEDATLLLNKLIAESANVRAILLSSDSPNADWSLSICGRLTRTDDGTLEVVPSSPDRLDKLILKESRLVSSLFAFKQASDFSGTPFASLFRNAESFNISLSFDLPDGLKLVLIGIGDAGE
jgi:hypothetical protein